MLVTTPLFPKGSGFSGNGRRCIRLRLKAPSGPLVRNTREGTGEYHTSRVRVGVCRVFATRASKPCARSAALIPTTTDRARLARASGVHFDNAPTSLFRFVGEQLNEPAPGLIADLTVEPSLLSNVATRCVRIPASGAKHAKQVKILDREHREAHGERPAGLVSMVQSALTFPLAVSCEVNGGFPATFRASPSSRIRPLEPTARRCARAACARTLDFLARGQPGERANTDVDAHRQTGVRRGTRIRKLDMKGGVETRSMPAARSACYPDLPWDRPVRKGTVPLELDVAYALQVESAVSDRNPACVSDKGESEGPETVLGFKPRIADALPLPPTLEKGSERSIEASQHLLLGPEVCVTWHQAVASQPLELGRLSPVVQGNPVLAPQPATMFERRVVERAGAAKLVLKVRALATGGVEAVSVAAVHERMFAWRSDERGWCAEFPAG